MEYFGYLASILIGITLGLIGGGGSILTVPILVYLFRIEPESATSYSLFIVGITAMVGSYRHYALGNLKVKSALYFALPSILSLLIVRKILLPKIPHTLFFIDGFEVTKDLLIMIVFALLMMAASLSMIRKTKTVETAVVHFPRLALIGLLVGFITGFLGAGGGFLIIPALLFFANLPMKQAVGTSLFIIFINSLIGFAGDMIGGISIDFRLLFTVTAIAILGMLIGTQLSKKIDGAKLKPVFGWFVLLMGIYIIAKEIFLK
ncbi:sulfite exporter TauE/SafE family protein [Flavobacterium sp.]|uniref:sulfite exporter TauE/SafE family protein n=1 Tax=Flavobacterium sp. TaxID=239 RepID=UPI002632D7ED|nr:sulfite exporter TauE/SafE family protein [Flavobacterium sp.]